VKGINMANFDDLFDLLEKSWTDIYKSGQPMLYKDGSRYLIVQRLPSNEMQKIASGNSATEAVLNAISYLVKEVDSALEDANAQAESYNKIAEKYVGIRNELVMAKV
jgi:hypothetical protein